MGARPVIPRIVRACLPSRSAGLIGALALLAAGTSAPARAGSRELMAACWPAGAPSALIAETRPVRGNTGSFSSPPDRALAPFAPLPAAWRGAVRRVELPKGRKLIALTLDLCEQPGEVAGYDGPIFDYLRAEGVKATVFVGGKWMASHPARTHQLMTDPQFELANHGWSHRNVRALAGAALVDEITGPQRSYEAARATLAGAACVAPRPGLMASVPPRLRLYRFPYGACNPAALDAVAAHGLIAVQWDVSTGDPSLSQSAAAIAGQMLRNVRPGSIIIAHANGRGHHTAAALPMAIPQLKAQGYEFVAVSELLAAGRPVLAETCYDSRPGDTDRYDFLFTAGRANLARGSRDWTTRTVPY